MPSKRHLRETRCYKFIAKRVSTAEYAQRPPHRVPAVKCAGGEARMMAGSKQWTLGAVRHCVCVGGHTVERCRLKQKPRESNASKTVVQYVM